MTKITATVNGKHYKIEARNHADTSDVCAAVSTIMCTLDGAIRNNSDAVCVYSCLESGYAKVEYIADGPLAEEDAAMALIGLMQIREAFPEQIKIEQNIFC